MHPPSLHDNRCLTARSQWRASHSRTVGQGDFQAGTTVVLDHGDTILTHRVLRDVTVSITAGSGTGPTTLVVTDSILRNVSISVGGYDPTVPSTLRMTDTILDAASTITLAGIFGAARLEIAGNAVINVGTIQSGAGAVTPAPLSGEISLAAGSTFINDGTVSVEWGGMRLTGSGSSMIVNNGTIDTGGPLVISGPLLGVGTVAAHWSGRSLAGDIFVSSGSVEFTGEVGESQTIRLAGTTKPSFNPAILQLDEPMQFLGVVEASGVNEQIVLPGASVTSAAYMPSNATTGHLVLMAQCEIIADLRMAVGSAMTGNYRTSDFQISATGTGTVITISAPSAQAVPTDHMADLIVA